MFHTLYFEAAKVAKSQVIPFCYLCPVLKIGNIVIEGFPVLAAPMEDISDPPFRRLCRHFGADLVFTEFISADGLIRDSDKSIRKLDLSEEERPVGIQIFGKDAESMAEATSIATSVSPDLIDINFGCPVRKVAMKGGGAGLLNDIPKMVKIARAMVKSTHLPVTAKTRLGWDESSKNIVEIALRLQDEGIAAITVHGRTRAQLYKGKADWTLIGELKSNPLLKIPVIGNGDITSGEEAVIMQKRYDVDGVMVGRAAIGNPWIYREIKQFAQTGEKLPLPDMEERVEVCRKHLVDSVAWKGEKLALFEMRAHYGHYFRGMAGAKEFRNALVTAMTLSEISELLNKWQKYITHPPRYQ
jgi:tRNA-dihydrouridine synthase B